MTDTGYIITICVLLITNGLTTVIGVRRIRELEAALTARRVLLNEEQLVTFRCVPTVNSVNVAVHATLSALRHRKLP